MVDRGKLVHDLRRLLRDLEEDLRERSEEDTATREHLREEDARAKDAERTALTYESWREEQLTQVAVARILGCVFVRFLEDNALIGAPRLSGVGQRLGLARDHHEIYFQEHPTETDREYLYAVFSEVAERPAAEGLFDRKHNPLWAVGLSGDGATKLLDFWRKVDPGTRIGIRAFSATFTRTSRRRRRRSTRCSRHRSSWRSSFLIAR